MGSSIPRSHSEAQVSATLLICRTLVPSFFKCHHWELVRNESETLGSESSSSRAEIPEHTAL